MLLSKAIDLLESAQTLHSPCWVSCLMFIKFVQGSPLQEWKPLPFESSMDILLIRFLNHQI